MPDIIAAAAFSACLVAALAALYRFYLIALAVSVGCGTSHSAATAEGVAFTYPVAVAARVDGSRKRSSSSGPTEKTSFASRGSPSSGMVLKSTVSRKPRRTSSDPLSALRTLMTLRREVSSRQSNCGSVTEKVGRRR
ncbi:hypothetical protein BDK51DRAFT_33512 [Blyttiomyces helicus]|uniref:Uncharacterized protein n=1 Tax=Blyttiomyces helicus TaxID=388810 RepID=A0A4P9WHI0_9FUNG|nr:hypothetical protein BDK51DRAFT_33512 [Blyttiomyces helicus]|eukprot:RKO92194.1 hypothetical protein BDK51DRAFT_33512 [Blyttiomyces helicus]